MDIENGHRDLYEDKISADVGAEYDKRTKDKPMNACEHGTEGCSGKGEKHWCEKPMTPTGLTEADFMKVHALVHSNPSKLVLPRDREAMDLILICARDIVNAWPKTTIRTLGEMTKRMDTLRQALEAAGK
jgi:hypothetical protein